MAIRLGASRTAVQYGVSLWHIPIDSREGPDAHRAYRLHVGSVGCESQCGLDGAKRVTPLLPYEAFRRRLWNARKALSITETRSGNASPERPTTPRCSHQRVTSPARVAGSGPLKREAS
jgi:hypothetical protein